MTTGSPELSVWQSPPNPAQSVLLAAGPNSEFPLLSKIWKCRLAIVTTLLGPTAPLGSGGEQPQRLLFPSKLMLGAGIPILPSTRCTTGSGTTGARGPATCGMISRSSFSRSVHPVTGSGFISRNGGEISNFTTGSTPRNSACTIGGELPDCVEGVRGCASRTIVIPAKHSRTPSKRRSLKNADWEVDLFFIDGVWVGWYSPITARNSQSQY